MENLLNVQIQGELYTLRVTAQAHNTCKQCAFMKNGECVLPRHPNCVDLATERGLPPMFTYISKR